jgi:hypothetical protein
VTGTGTSRLRQIMGDEPNRSSSNIWTSIDAPAKLKYISDEEICSRVIRDIHGLDIVLPLQTVNCYILPHKSLFPTIDFSQLLQKLTRAKIKFEELVRQRKFKKIFGLYGYTITNVCLVLSLDFASK